MKIINTIFLITVTISAICLIDTALLKKNKRNLTQAQRYRPLIDPVSIAIGLTIGGLASFGGGMGVYGIQKLSEQEKLEL